MVHVIVISGLQANIREEKGLLRDFRVENKWKEKSETDVQSVFYLFWKKGIG